MRLGLVERGTYKTTEFADLTGYQLEVNGFIYNFGDIIAETRRRIHQLWGIEFPPALLRNRLHFSEQAFFNRMVKNEHYGIFSKHTGAHICLGLVDQADTCNLVIHEIAHEIHYRQGGYITADEVLQEAVAILAEEQFGVRDFDFDPHFTSQQLLHQLQELPAFGKLPFSGRWDILTKLHGAQEMSFLINRYLDDAEGGHFNRWLNDLQEDPRPVVNAVAQASVGYALFNRRLLLNRLMTVEPQHRSSQLTRALMDLKRLDSQNPRETLANLMERAFHQLN